MIEKQIKQVKIREFMANLKEQRRIIAKLMFSSSPLLSKPSRLSQTLEMFLSSRMSSQVQEIPLISFSGQPSFNQPYFQILDLFSKMFDTARIRCDADRVLVSLAQIVDFLASFPKSGHTLKTKLQVKIYDCFKFMC